MNREELAMNWSIINCYSNDAIFGFLAGYDSCKDENRKLKEALMDMVNQHTAVYEGLELKGYDSGFLSSNESALELCVELGLIKKERVIR